MLRLQFMLETVLIEGPSVVLLVVSHMVWKCAPLELGLIQYII